VVVVQIIDGVPPQVFFPEKSISLSYDYFINFSGKNTWRRTPSIIWTTTTRILIIFGVPPHKYKYLK
jgi:hypothetical protein